MTQTITTTGLHSRPPEARASKAITKTYRKARGEWYAQERKEAHRAASATQKRKDTDTKIGIMTEYDRSTKETTRLAGLHYLLDCYYTLGVRELDVALATPEYKKTTQAMTEQCERLIRRLAPGLILRRYD